jgi:hypothetical protein
VKTNAPTEQGQTGRVQVEYRCGERQFPSTGAARSPNPNSLDPILTRFNLRVGWFPMVAGAHN